MKNQPGYYLLFFIFCCFLSSCLSGKYSHYPRVKIEPQNELKTESEAPLNSAETGNPSSNKSQTKQEQVFTEEKKIPPGILSCQSFQSVIVHHHRDFKSSPSRKLKKGNKVERFGENMENFGIFIWFIIVGLPSILLVIAGFIMGYFNIMVGFWICWVLGMIGVVLSCIAGIAVWADGPESDWTIISSLFYLVMFCMAIAFILIVLLI